MGPQASSGCGPGREGGKQGLDVTIISQSITILPARERESDILTLVQCVFVMSGVAEAVISESRTDSHFKAKDTKEGPFKFVEVNTTLHHC